MALPALGGVSELAFALARSCEGTPLSVLLVLGSVGFPLVSVGEPPLQAS
jgi:hypothetical protein